MRSRSALSAGLMLAGMVAVPVIATGQTIMVDPSTPGLRQRAPGVPMAPIPDSIESDRVSRTHGAAPRRSDRPGNAEFAMPKPDRDLPMPRPVPSIIAPNVPETVRVLEQ